MVKENVIQKRENYSQIIFKGKIFVITFQNKTATLYSSMSVRMSYTAIQFYTRSIEDKICLPR